MKFPTGGKVRERLRMLNWCNSNTDSTVWMKEEQAVNTMPWVHCAQGFFQEVRYGKAMAGIFK